MDNSPKDAQVSAASTEADPLSFARLGQNPSGKRIAIAGFGRGPHAVIRVIATLVRGMVHAGVEVDLLLPDPRVELQGLDCPVGTHPLDDRDDRAASVQLSDYLATRSPDAIMTLRDRASARILRLDAGQRPRTVLRVGTDVIEKLGKKPRLVRDIARRRLATLYASADALIGVSDGGCRALCQLLAGRRHPPVHRIYNCIERDQAHRLAAPKSGHLWLDRKQKPTILAVGRLVRAKDHVTLLRAFHRVRETLDCRLIIIGEGRQRSSLERLIAKLGLEGCVDLPGFDPNPLRAMQRADLFVLSSRYEGFGLVLIESLAVGTACVSTDCPSGPSEILGDGTYGPLVAVGDDGALADAIIATLAHPPTAAHLCGALERFTPNNAVPAYLSVLLGSERPEQASTDLGCVVVRHDPPAT